MKIQLEQIDLLHPWPTLQLHDGSHAMRVLVRIGNVPVGEVLTRSVRTGFLTPRRLRRRVARKLGYQVLSVLAREAVAAGPEALARLSTQFNETVRRINLSASSSNVFPKLLERHFLLETGLPEPWPQLIATARRNARAYPLPPVTVAVCTRDRASQLEGCIRELLELDYPNYEVLIVDNSTDPHSTSATKEVCDRLGVSFAHEPRPGLSRARNTALAAARHRWIAFTDDDCRPERSWLAELARKLQDTNCRCVCGLVLPAQLDNSAEIAFEIYGGLGRGFHDAAYPAHFRRENRFRPAPTWNIGAGASMLLDGRLARELGGFDVDLGAGSACPCSEDTLLWYQFLRRGHSIHYTPRAIVHHYHRSSPESFRKQIYSYAVGHAAYHVRCAFSFRDYRSLLHLTYHLPKWFWNNYRRAARGRTRYPRSIIPLEVRGTIAGIFTYAAVKVRRWLEAALDRSTGGASADQAIAPSGTVQVIRPKIELLAHEPAANQKPVRVA